MTRALIFVLALSPMGLAAAPRLDLDVRLDPGGRTLAARAHVTDEDGVAGFVLAPRFKLSAVEVNGKAVNPAALSQEPGGRYRLPRGSRGVVLVYAGELEALARLDHRQVLTAQPPMASEEGSYLPGGSGWYPDPGRPFTYRLRLALPPAQKGLVPGALLHESETAAGYAAEYEHAHPAEGIDLMAGPYQVDERKLALPGGRPVRIRTWFHRDLAELAPAYLDDAARYLSRYSALIGDYPFGMFSMVSSPLPTGFGMAGLTYLGREVIRLPFIRATSLGHEVLHNWWGNGVLPDWQTGNWSEGLTTFLADYAYKEDAGEDAAREARLGWLRDLAAVPPESETALRQFVSRHHGVSSIVGYNKAAMVFLMLRDLIGREAFERGLRLLWREKRFQTASWADLETAFAKSSGRPLGRFFRQWVDEASAPDIRLLRATARSGDLHLELAQSGQFVLRVPLRLIYRDRREDVWVDLAGREQTLAIPGKGDAIAVQLDPDYRLWRRIDPGLMPPILREVFVAPQATLLIADTDTQWQAAARSLAGKVLDARADVLKSPGAPASGALLIIGTEPAVDAVLRQRSLSPRPQLVAGRGSAQVWAGRDARGRPYAVVSARDAAALNALERGLPHYGKQSWLVFDGPRAMGKGVGDASPEQIDVKVGTPGR